MRQGALLPSLFWLSLQPWRSPRSASSALGCHKLAVRHRLPAETGHSHISTNSGLARAQVVSAQGCGRGRGRSACALCSIAGG